MSELTYVYEDDFLRQNLSIPFVALQYGLVFDEDHRALCPFHEDREHPNLELMVPGDDGVPWWYCRACGKSGDVLGLIMAMASCPFSQAVNLASKFYPDQPDDVPRGPTQQSVKYEVTPEWEERVRECSERARSHLDSGLLSYAYGFFDANATVDERRSFDLHLIERWRWGLDEEANVVIPHYDRYMKLVCVKVRNTTTRAWASYGKYADLYGIPEMPYPVDQHMLLCEGESDCAWSDYRARLEGLQVTVLALPSGAGSFSLDWLDYVKERWASANVCLGFDADEAGTKATERWASMLAGCKVISLQAGMDLRSSGLSLVELFERSTEWRDVVGR